MYIDIFGKELNVGDTIVFHSGEKTNSRLYHGIIIEHDEYDKYNFRKAPKNSICVKYYKMNSEFLQTKYFTSPETNVVKIIK